MIPEQNQGRSNLSGIIRLSLLRQNGSPLILCPRFYFSRLICDLIFIIIVCGLVVISKMASCGSLEPYEPMFRNSDPFLRAIHQEEPKQPLQAQLTGITIPHHLLAADLIARGFWAASSSKIDRVILLSPDHFSKARHAFATSLRPFRTVLGIVEPDRAAVAALLAGTDLFEDSRLFKHEHGIAAVLPFVAHFFPAARIVPIAISPNAKKADWDAAVSRLLPLIGSRTLVVQSTDFSHYLPSWIAKQRDQETLNILSANSSEAVVSLVPSDHLDSKGAQYLQMRLQAQIGVSGPVVIASRNSSEYTHVDGNSTSYVVQIFSSNPLDPTELEYADQQIVYFGGDTLFGRYLLQPLQKEEPRRAVFNAIHRATGGLPIIINLEGVGLDEPPEQLPGDLHVMPAGLAVPALKEMNVTAAGLANNHSFDLGAIGLEETMSMLQKAHVRAIRHDEIADFGKFRLIALNFISKRQIPDFPMAEESELDGLCSRPAQPPLLAFVHWGNEQANAAGQNEHIIADRLLDCGVSGIIGAHSHRASTEIEAPHGGAQQITYSLGNLLFDQSGAISSGAILELRVFNQGTFATRLIPIANLYDIARRELVKSRSRSSLDTSSEGSRGD
jgi:poly-gamma-glutamate synthesis protein (capsule biosynthesis protein)